MADGAYHAMLHQRRSQCIVISGESGAGNIFNMHWLCRFISNGFDFLTFFMRDRKNGYGQLTPQTTRQFGQSIKRKSKTILFKKTE